MSGLLSFRAWISAAILAASTLLVTGSLSAGTPTRSVSLHAVRRIETGLVLDRSTEAVAGGSMPARFRFRRNRDDFDMNRDFGDDGSVCCFGCVSCLMAIPIFYFASSLAMGLLVYRGAKQHSDPDAVLWGVFAFLLNAIGVLIYLNVHRRRPTIPSDVATIPPP